MGSGPFRCFFRPTAAHTIVVVAVITVGAVLWMCPPASAADPSQSPADAHFSPWNFRADWTRGYAGWMSFPLSQDVGYDPTIYTDQAGSRTVLVRTLTAHGEKQVRFGFVRPLHFRADARTSCDLEYDLHAAGQIVDATVILAAADGRHYSAPLPSTNGVHRVHLTGAQLHLAKSTEIVVIVLQARLQNPPLASRSEWILRSFSVAAERIPSVTLTAPSLVDSSDDGHVASIVLRPGQTLHIAWKNKNLPTQISLFTALDKAALQQSAPVGAKDIDIPIPAGVSPGLWRAEVAQQDARTDFRFLVLGEVPAHPRVLLSQARLDQLRGPQYAAVRQQIHTRAAHLATTITYSAGAGDNIELMPSGPGIQPAYPDQIRPYFDLMDSYSSAIAYNALDYRLNGNSDSLAAARRALLTMVKWRTWEPPRFRSHGLQTYYEVGVTGQLVALGYDLIADQLSADEKAAVEQAFWTQVIAPAVREYYVADRDPIGASNFMANSLGGALAATIAVADDTPNWKRRDAPALAELEFAFERLLDGLFPGDGSEAEPTGYENFAMQGLSWGMSALRAVDVTPRGICRMLEGFWWPYYDTVAPGVQLDTGDFNGHLTKLPGFAWAAEYSGIPEVRAFYQGDTQVDLAHGATVANNGHFLEEMSGPLDLVCCSTPIPSFRPPPSSRVFPLRGSAALRSGWEPASTVISLRVGPWFNHNHYDEGTFQVATHGEVIIDEAGYGRYYLDPRYPDYFSQAPGHNTLLVDGDAFSQQAINGRYWPGFTHPAFRTTLLAHTFDYLNADLTSAYDGRLASYSREYFFVKPGLLVVRDHVQAKGPHRYSWLLHVSPGSQLSSEGPAAFIQTGKAAAALLAVGPNTGWKTESTPLSIALFDHLDKPSIPAHQELVLTSPATAQTEFTVGMNFGASTQSSDLRLTRWSTTAGDGFRSSGEHPASMLFRTKPGLLTIGDFSTDGDALIQGADSDWLATGARVVRQKNVDLLTSPVAVDVAMEHRGTALEVTLHSSQPSTVNIYSSTAPAQVEIDGQSVHAEYARNMIAVPLPSPGEHHVIIQ